MMDNGKYWDKAWSLVDGCTPVSEACDNCWLQAIDHRFGKTPNNVTFREDRLNIPLKRKKPTVWAIWSDLFHERVKILQICRAFDIMMACPHHTFLILTKRPERMWGFIEYEFSKYFNPIDNIWLGVTAENQEQADKRIPWLLETRAAHHFVSMEPLLGPIDFTNVDGDIATKMSEINPREISFPGELIDLVICGGESGPKARPMHPNWARSVWDQCEAEGIPFYFKQWGEWGVTGKTEIPPGSDDFAFWETVSSTNSKEVGRIKWQAATGEVVDREPLRGWKVAETLERVGKKAAGRLLDGQEHNYLPWRPCSRCDATPCLCDARPDDL